jgi:MHS family proline/betaine transporter-like MFS transporter
MKVKKNLLLITLGSSLEYYDFVIYGLLSMYVSKVFFPVSNHTIAIIQGFIIFALGYVVRPISGTILGIIADRYSNIKVFSFSILLMGGSTFMIGILPSYETIGIAAPILLALARLVQGASFASELPGAVTIFNNPYFKKQINVSRSIGYLMSSTGFGFVLASSVVYLLNVVFTPEQILEGAWRIPFLIGGGLAFFSYFIRRNLEKCEEFSSIYMNKTGKSTFSFMKDVFIADYSIILKGLGITTIFAAGTVLLIYLPHILIENALFKPKVANLGLFTGLITYSAVSVLFGRLVKENNAKIFFVVSSLLFPIFFYFAIVSIKSMQNEWLVFVLFSGFEIFMSVLFVSGFRMLSYFFKAIHRNTSISFCYNIAFAVFAFSPAVLTYLISRTQRIESMCLFLSLACIISAWAAWRAKPQLES